jgi:hypothetical protein
MRFNAGETSSAFLKQMHSELLGLLQPGVGFHIGGLLEAGAIFGICQLGYSLRSGGK